MLPAAVGRTAVAVSGLADCGVVIGMARSRVWIGVLGVLLGGIVALNVWGLSLSAGSSATAAKIGALERENSVMRGRIAKRLSTGEIEAEAARLGLAIPAPDAVHYLVAGDGDAAKAANRLAGGELAAVPPLVDVATVPADPAVEAAVDPAAAEATSALPTTTDPAALAVATEPVTDPASAP